MRCTGRSRTMPTRSGCTPPAAWRESHDRIWTRGPPTSRKAGPRHARSRPRSWTIPTASGSMRCPGNYTPQVGKSRDGRIWFLPWDGVSVLDPRRLPTQRPSAAGARRTDHRRPAGVRRGSRAAAATARARRLDRFHGAEFRRAREDPVPLYPRGPGSRVEGGRQLSTGPLFQPASRPIPLPRAGEQQQRRLEREGRGPAVRDRACLLRNTMVPGGLRRSDCGADLDRSPAARPACGAAVEFDGRGARGRAHTHRPRTARHAAAGFSGTSADVPVSAQPAAGPAGGSEATARARARAGQCGDD